MKKEKIERLNGGRDEIFKIDNIVKRPAGRWTASTQKLLYYLHKKVFHKVPKPLGFDEKVEKVTFIKGKVCNYPLDEQAASLESLISAAKLLREYHNASEGFDYTKENWMLPVKEPVEVICHGDFAPYNVPIINKQAVGIIDFDTAHPAPRLWDIAYAVYRWAPLMLPENFDSFGSLKEQTYRTQIFCDSYGLSVEERKALMSMIVERLEALIFFMQKNRNKLNFSRDLKEGHHLKYLRDIQYIKAHFM